MRKSFLQSSWSRKAAIGFILTALCLGLFVACDDSSSAGGDGGSGGNRGGIPDTVETFMELSDYDCGKSQKCVATYLTEYHNMAVCDGDNGWVIATLIEKMDCDFSSSSAKVTDKGSDAKSSDSKSNDPAEVTDDSSDSKGNPSSAGTSTKSSNSNSSGNDAKSSSSAGKVAYSSSEEMKNAWNYLNPDINYGEFTDERDGQVYKTVKIGDQIWMAQNLNYDPGDVSSLGRYAWSGCYGDGALDEISKRIMTEEEFAANCSRYGRLYTWEVAMNKVNCGYHYNCDIGNEGTQGVCPKGWHLPTKEEWKKLVEPIASGVGDQTTYWSYLGASVELKTADGWKEYSTSTSGTNASGFSALPAGFMYIGEFFRSKGIGTFFWSSSVYGSDESYCLRLQHDDDSALLWGEWKKNGFSVRCLKDSD